MALGYEGYIKVGGQYALGTGTSVPRAQVRLDSSSGFGGEIKTPISDIGIGAPRTYDWEQNNGSVSFELYRDFWTTVIYPWIFDRQTNKQIYFVSRNGNIQQFDYAFWNSISISASENSVVDGSIGFNTIERTNYTYGVQGLQGYIENKDGYGLFCPPATFPSPLNPSGTNRNPLPYWKTRFEILSVVIPFINWSLDFSQDIVEFFTCGHTGGGDPGPKEPFYLAAGPMKVTFSGAYMLNDVLADSIASASLFLDNLEFKMGLLEKQNISDDVQGGDSLVPLTVDYEVFSLVQ